MTDRPATLTGRRRKYHYLNPVPIRMIYERWIGKYRDRLTVPLLDLKDRANVIRPGAAVARTIHDQE